MALKTLGKNIFFTLSLFASVAQANQNTDKIEAMCQSGVISTYQQAFQLNKDNPKKAFKNENYLTLANHYHYGTCGAPRNLNLAAQTLDAAVQAGDHYRAAYNLGALLLNEPDTFPEQTNNALNLLIMAANNMNAPAQLKLGRVFEQGKFVQQDMTQALYYYVMASGNTVSESSLTAGKLNAQNDRDCRAEASAAVRRLVNQLGPQEIATVKQMVVAYTKKVNNQAWFKKWTKDTGETLRGTPDWSALEVR